MKIFTVRQIRQLDAYTIEHEPIVSIDLMERAADTFFHWFVENFPAPGKVFVFCGPGNNGGDGLALARMLNYAFYEVSVFALKIGAASSGDFLTNLERLRQQRIPFTEISEGQAFPSLPQGGILIDAIFGSGLSRPVQGYWANFIQHLNNQPVSRVSLDIPSGMFADKPTEGVSMFADYTFSFEMPKLAFLFPENAERVGEWTYRSIGLSPAFIKSEPTPFFYLDGATVKPLLKSRKKYAHKGSYGHALLIAGGFGKMGAAVLAAKACLRSGAGLLTVHAPRCGYEILQVAIPEAMVSVDDHQFAVTEIREHLSRFKAIGIGCGIGTNDLTFKSLEGLFLKDGLPLVLDADALNLLAGRPDLLKMIPHHSILTPHPKEFERLFGPTPDSFARNTLQREKAMDLGIYIILKGANTCIACPDGTCWFNSTGNPGMATGGSGDVLTGMLTGLLAQGYSPFEASLLGVYLHGLAGDLAAHDLQQEALLASDIIEHLGKAFIVLKG
jgi:NAD(P)H-hydrate epimerase